MKVNIAPFFRQCRRFLSNSWQWCWRHICTCWLGFRELPVRIRELRRKEKPIRADFTPEMEAIMNKLIRSTVGIGGALDREFARQSAQYDKDNPIGEHQARELIQSLLMIAIANRDKINGRIEHSVEFGSLYYRYYSKLQTIYNLTTEANARREEMGMAQQDYYFAYNMHKNVREMTYEAQATKKNTTPKNDPPPKAASMEGEKTV